MSLNSVLRDWILINLADRMIGRIDEFKPPNLNLVVEEFRGAGMDTTMPIDMGMEALTASWTTSGVDRGTLASFGIIAATKPTVRVRGALLDPNTGVAVPVVHTMTGLITSIEPGAYKPGERATLSVTQRLTYYKLEHTTLGLPLTEIDVINGVRIIDGVDYLAQMRAIVGR